MKKDTENEILLKAHKNQKFRGKHVVVVGNEIHILSTKDKKARARLLTSLVRKYPQSVPMIAFIPKEDTLILVF